MEVETAVDKDCSLNLNPNPTYPRVSDESMESNDSSENVFDSEPNQVDENGKFKTTVPCDTCDRCRQPCHLPKKVSWVADSWCDPCFRELFGDYKPA